MRTSTVRYRCSAILLALLASASEWSSAQSANTGAAEMTFFGFAVGQVSPRWRPGLDSSYRLGPEPFWTDEFTIAVVHDACLVCHHAEQLGQRFGGILVVIHDEHSTGDVGSGRPTDGNGDFSVVSQDARPSANPH